jgi:hypothetical protein
MIGRDTAIAQPAGGLSRRLILQMAAGSLAAPGLAAAGTSPAPSSLPDPAGHTEPRALLDAYRRIRYSSGPEVTFWWMRATKYGLVNHQLTPLFGMEIGNFSRTRTVGPDSFTATALEMVFFTDLVSGERVEAITNPYTGERIPRADSLVGPATISYTLDGPAYPAGLPGVKFDIRPAMGMFAVEGDDVWLRDDNATTVTAADTGAVQFVVSDWATYHCARAALADGNTASVPGEVAFNSVSSWIKWMNMGDRPGSMLSRGSGRKFARLADMPQSFLGILRARHPELARDPAAALDRPPFSFAP